MSPRQPTKPTRTPPTERAGDQEQPAQKKTKPNDHDKGSSSTELSAPATMSSSPSLREQYELYLSKHEVPISPIMLDQAARAALIMFESDRQILYALDRFPSTGIQGFRWGGVKNGVAQRDTSRHLYVSGTMKKVYLWVLAIVTSPWLAALPGKPVATAKQYYICFKPVRPECHEKLDDTWKQLTLPEGRHSTHNTKYEDFRASAYAADGTQAFPNVFNATEGIRPKSMLPRVPQEEVPNVIRKGDFVIIEHSFTRFLPKNVSSPAADPDQWTEYDVGFTLSSVMLVARGPRNLDDAQTADDVSIDFTASE